MDCGTGELSVHKGDGDVAAEATLLRREIVQALFDAGGGHYGGSLSVLDILLILYRRVLRIAPTAPDHPERDRLVLSKGHAAVALYAVLRRLGFFTDSLASYGRHGSPLEGHPDMHALPGVDFSTGSLGQGLAVGLGMALAPHVRGSDVWVVMGDGECQEGQVWETAMLAARLGAGNLHAVVDSNGFQECTWPAPYPREMPPVEDLAGKWAAFGWRVLDVDGHDHAALTAVLREAAGTAERPSVVVARTRKGYGVPVVEADPERFHCATVTPREHTAMLAGLR